jgi:hypothetical protein
MEETSPTLTKTLTPFFHALFSFFKCTKNVIIPMVPAAMADATLVFIPAGQFGFGVSDCTIGRKGHMPCRRLEE